MRMVALGLALTASPAAAAGERFFSLGNTDFIVLLAFLLFIGVLVYFKVPGLLGGLLDKRSAGIQSDLDEARALRDEAQDLLASYERKSREIQAQADRIVEHAKREAAASAEQAKADLDRALARRMAGAEEQIAQAEAGAVREVRDRAIAVAVAAAREVVAEQMTSQSSSASIDAAIDEVGAKLH